MKYPVTIECPSCGYAWELPRAGCTNPWCLAQPNLTEERRGRIEAAQEEAKRSAAARAERQRLYALSFKKH